MELMFTYKVIVTVLLIIFGIVLFKNYRSDIMGIFISTELYEKTYRLINYNSNKKGCAIFFERGWALTAQHTAKKNDNIVLICKDKEVPGKVVDEDKEQDLSLIQLDKGIGYSTKIGYHIPKDRKVYTYLHDRGYIKGEVIYNFSEKGHDFYVADIGGEKGDSGAGVFNSKGHLIGLISSIWSSDKLSKKYIIFSAPSGFNKTVRRWKNSKIIS